VDQEQFIKAMVIISAGGVCTVETKNDSGVFGEAADGKMSINLVDCCHKVIKKLMQAGYTCHMRAGKLSVNYHG